MQRFGDTLNLNVHFHALTRGGLGPEQDAAATDPLAANEP